MVDAVAHIDLPVDTGFACLAMLGRFYQVPVDPGQLRHELGLTSDTVLSTDHLHRAAKSLGFKVRKVRSSVDRLPRLNLPAIARLTDGGFIILARASAEKVLVQDPRDSGPKELSLQQLADTWTGELLLITTRAHLAGISRRFDFTWFIPAVVRYRRLFGEVFVASFFLQVFALISPIFFQLVVDKVLVHRGLTTLDVLAFGLITVSIFEVLLGGLRSYVFSHTASRVDVELGARLFRHLLSLPIAYFQARQAGHSVARMRELETVRSFLTSSALTLVLDLIFTVVFLAVMWFYSPVLTGIVLGAIPFYVALSAIVTPILRRRIEEKFDRGSENQTFLVESVVGVETLKAMAVEPQMQRRWEEQLAGYVRAGFRATTLSNVGSQLAQLINKIVVALILWFGARLVIDNQLTVGQLVAFNMLASRVSMPVLRLAQLWQDFQQVRISVARLGDILNAPAEVGSAGRGALPRLAGRITLDHVTFRYRLDAPEVLKAVSLEVPPGQVLGVVGPSGSGKSTLTKLIQRLYVPESGRVMIDGMDLAVVDPARLRRQIGVVLQDNVLFNRTVRENIALADPGLPLARIIHSAKLAGAHEFILELAQGYDTVIGERGSTLSGGQRQRIAIARALATDPQIVIFDEATSALDYESEHAIQRNMREICKGRTVIIIAHRLAAVRGADRIITVEQGRIVEDGTHNELLARRGRYATLYAHQVGGLHSVPAE